MYEAVQLPAVGMVLNGSNIAHYLLGRGLIDYASLVDGDFMVLECSRRNRNFKVLRNSRPGFFLKQVRNWDQQSILTLQYEATCYRLASNDPAFASLVPLMPAFHHFDEAQKILIIELLRDSETLDLYHARLGSFPEETGALVGRVLGQYHRESKVQGGEGDSIFQKRMPWILQVHQINPAFMDPLSGANLEVLNIVKTYPEFYERLNELQGEYKFGCLIHGDIRWENCAIYSPNGQPELKLIDWEMADIGDPCWDAGAVFQSYITAWIMSIPIEPGLPPSQQIHKARYPIESMTPALKSFWSTYCSGVGVQGPAARELLRRSVRYGAARMIQTVYEHMNVSSQITPNAICLLQVSLNILQHPDEAVSDLLGM